MSNLFARIKNNKFTFLLFLVVVYILFKQTNTPIPLVSNMMYRTDEFSDSAVGSAPMMAQTEGKIGIMPPIPPIGNDFVPQPDVVNRLVIQETSLSLVVEKVREALDQMVLFTSQIGGYMVNTSLTSPEEAPFGTVVVRVPADKLIETLERFRELSLKVTSENIVGYDVTDEFEDIEARLETLNLTKDKFEAILKSAASVEDILTVQRELINLQSQIDSLKGRAQYLEKNAQLAKITVYVSTDELSLPFTPTNRFRPNVIFKQAVRSLFERLQRLGEWLIWIGVYAPIWVPVFAIGYMFYRKNKS